MDLNPQVQDWSLAHGPYEIADHCISTKSNVLIVLSAWVDSQRKLEELDEKYDWSTVDYWASRTRPLWSDGNNSDSSEEEQDTLTSDPPLASNETIVIVCNRTGQENGQSRFISSISTITEQLITGKTFAGSSAIFSMKPAFGHPRLLGMMGRHEEGVYKLNIQTSS